MLYFSLSEVCTILYALFFHLSMYVPLLKPEIFTKLGDAQVAYDSFRSSDVRKPLLYIRFQSLRRQLVLLVIAIS